MTKIKICGLSREADIEYANELMPDFIGFVFTQKSKRYVNTAKAKALKSKLNSNIKAVGVFVNEDIDTVISLVKDNIIDIIQLHGCEDENYINKIKALSKKPILKAFNITSASNIERAVKSSADYILLDNGDGGTGKAFDWSVINNINRPYFLAGGLNVNNISNAIKRFKPFAVDISSGVETNGFKDYNKIKKLINVVKQL